MNSHTNTPLVSVVIPAFNEEKRIVDTLLALTKQTYTPFEVIVVDNNSTDDTNILVKPFLIDKRFTLLHEKTPGVMNARECGRQHARGEIIALLDADCIPHTHWIRNAVVKFDQDNVVAVVGPYDYYDASFIVRAITFFIQSLFMRPLNWIMQKTNHGAVMSGGNAFIKSDALNKIHGFDTNFVFYGDDAHTATQLSKIGWVQTTNTITVKSSARRYEALGFFATQKKYNYWNMAHLFNRTTNMKHTHEVIHPR